MTVRRAKESTKSAIPDRPISGVDHSHQCRNAAGLTTKPMGWIWRCGLARITATKFSLLRHISKAQELDNYSKVAQCIVSMAQRWLLLPVIKPDSQTGLANWHHGSSIQFLSCQTERGCWTKSSTRKCIQTRACSKWQQLNVGFFLEVRPLTSLVLPQNIIPTRALYCSTLVALWLAWHSLTSQAHIFLAPLAGTTLLEADPPWLCEDNAAPRNALLQSTI